MAVDRRAKPYYYLSSCDVDADKDDNNKDSMDVINNHSSEASQYCNTREGVARLLISHLCETQGKNTVKNILAASLPLLVQQGLTTADALKEFCQSYPQCFIVRQPTPETSGEEEIEVTTKLNLCNAFLKKRASCPEDGECGYLHLCRFFMLSVKCECGTPKQVARMYGHQLMSDHNQTVLKQHLMEHLKLKNVRILVRRLNARQEQTRPIVCGFYNKQGGCVKGDRCALLHLCRRFVFGDCKFGTDCIRCHDLEEPTVKAILERYRIPAEHFHSTMMASPNSIPSHPPEHPIPTATTTTTTSVYSSSNDPQKLTLARAEDGSLTLVGEQEEQRGGHWGSPLIKPVTVYNSSTSVISEAAGERESAPTVFSTVFSRRHRHVMDSDSSQQIEDLGLESTEDGEEESPVLSSMNPFSYTTVNEQNRQWGSDSEPASMEDKLPSVNPAPASLDDPKADNSPISMKAEDFLVKRGQDQDSNFIPLKQVDRSLSGRLILGRPVVASIPRQMKIKPELGICLSLDMSRPSEHAQMATKKSEDFVSQNALGSRPVGASSSAGSKPASSGLEEVSQSASSLQSIISSLIDNVKKLHAKNPGPEQHLLKYLSELGHSDKLNQEMKAADTEEEEEEENREIEGRVMDGMNAGRNSLENDRVGRAVERCYSDGQIAEPDEETEKGMVIPSEPEEVPLQENVLIDYNHCTTVDLIGDMLREGSPSVDSPSHPPESDPTRRTSSMRGSRGSGSQCEWSQYEQNSSRKWDRDFDVVSDANGSVSDISSEEYHVPDRRHKSGDKAQPQIKSDRPSHTAHAVQQTRTEELESSCHQDAVTAESSEQNLLGGKETLVEEKLPGLDSAESCSTNKTGTVLVTEMDNTGNVAALSDKPENSEPPVKLASSSGSRSVGQKSRPDFPDRNTSSSGGKELSDQRFHNSKSAPESRCLSGNRKLVPQPTHSSNKTLAQTKGTADRNNKSSVKKKSADSAKQSDSKFSGSKKPYENTPLDSKRSSTQKKRVTDSKEGCSDSRQTDTRSSDGGGEPGDSKGPDAENDTCPSSPHNRQSIASPGKSQSAHESSGHQDHRTGISHTSESTDRSRTTDWNKRSPNRNRMSPDWKRRSPNRNRTSPDWNRRSPNRNRTSPDWNRRSPNRNRMSPDWNRSPNRNRVSTDLNRSPNRNKMSPDWHRTQIWHRRTSDDNRSPDQPRSPPRLSHTDSHSALCVRSTLNQHYSRLVGQDWTDRKRAESDDRISSRQVDSFRRDTDDHLRFRDKGVEEMDICGRFRSTSRERSTLFCTRTSHEEFFREDWLMRGSFIHEACMHSERNRFPSPHGEGNGSLCRDRNCSGSGGRLGGERHSGWRSRKHGLSPGDKCWKAGEEVFLTPTDAHNPGEEVFHGERFPAQPPAPTDFPGSSEEDFHRKGSRGFDRSPGRMLRSDKERFRSRRSPSPHHFVGQQEEDILTERDVRGGSRGDHCRSPYNSHSYPGDVLDHFVEGSMRHEEGMAVGQGEDWLGDSRPSQTSPRSQLRFTGHKDWNRNSGRNNMSSLHSENQVIPMSRSLLEIEEERLEASPASRYYPENIAFGSHLHNRRSRSPSGGFGHSGERDHYHDMSSGFSAEGNKERFDLDTGEQSSLRDCIDDFLDKVPHINHVFPLRGIEGCSEDPALRDGAIRPHHHDDYRRFHSQHKRESLRPTKRHLEEETAESMYEEKRRRDDQMGREREHHLIGEPAIWDMASPGRDMDLDGENTSFSARIPRGRERGRASGLFKPYFKDRRASDDYLRTGLKVKMIFNVNDDVVQGTPDYRDLRPNQDLDQPADNFSQELEDPSPNRLLFHEGREEFGDMGDMIYREREKLMRSDLRNLLRMRQNSRNYWRKTGSTSRSAFNAARRRGGRGRR